VLWTLVNSMPDEAAIASADEASRVLAGQLPENCRTDFLRLTRTLLHGPAFQWLLVDAPHDHLRHRVMNELDRVLLEAHMLSSRLPLASLADINELEANLIVHAEGSPVVHVLGRRDWFDAARWDAFNVRRERVAAQVRAKLVFWLDSEAIAMASRGAPDLWAWRAGVYAFVPLDSDVFFSDNRVKAPVDRPLQDTTVETRSADERRARVREIREWLARESHDDDRLVQPYDELGRLLYSLGEYAQAEAHWRDHELPLHQRRGDERTTAIAMGKIADILQARGQLDEALRIRREGQLPVFERLGDERSRAATMSKIADVLEDRGQLDEALRIRREDVLPVFERLGDMRERAVTMGQIADVLQARGQFDEALRIRREDVLPAFERLGDVRERAVTIGKIADILQYRGQLDEALHIRRQGELPIYERLGDARALLVGRTNLALNLIARGRPEEDAAEIGSLLAQALADAQRLGLPEAAQIEAIMRRGFGTPPEAEEKPDQS
jgi:tetratricopeptide (TPR) repeat protein